METRELILAEEARKTAFEAVLHQQTNHSSGGLRSMMGKDSTAHAAAVDDYFRHFSEKDAKDETELSREQRKLNYASLSRQYYNLATDFYEYGWSQSFHFCRFAHGETFDRAIARHEHYLAATIGITKGMKVLDVGCGIGAPAREIAKFTGAHITGITINKYQVERATAYAQKEGLAGHLNFVHGDFMKLPFEDGSFDAVYAIEATVHAPSLEDVYREIRRVLKPGGTFGVYEWLMTHEYDETDPDHRQIRLDIEQGDGIAQMFDIDHGVKAMRRAGFDLVQHEDLAVMSATDPAPWYWPIDSDLRYAQTWGDLIMVARMNRWGRAVMHSIFAGLEMIRLLPKGTKTTAESLARAADALVEGGKRQLFTPMYLMVGRKPDLLTAGFE